LVGELFAGGDPLSEAQVLKKLTHSLTEVKWEAICRSTIHGYDRISGKVPATFESRLWSSGDLKTLQFLVKDLDPSQESSLGYEAIAVGEGFIKTKESRFPIEALSWPVDAKEAPDPDLPKGIEGREDLYHKVRALSRLTYGMERLMLGALPFDTVGGLDLYCSLVLDKPAYTEVYAQHNRHMGLVFRSSTKTPKTINGTLTVPFNAWYSLWHSRKGEAKNWDNQEVGKLYFLRAELWLAPEYDYLPLRVDYFKPDKTKLMGELLADPKPKAWLEKRCEVQQYKKLKSGAWFPVLGRVIKPSDAGSETEKEDLRREDGDIDLEYMISVEDLKEPK